MNPFYEDEMTIEGGHFEVDVPPGENVPDLTEEDLASLTRMIPNPGDSMQVTFDPANYVIGEHNFNNFLPEMPANISTATLNISTIQQRGNLVSNTDANHAVGYRILDREEWEQPVKPARNFSIIEPYDKDVLHTEELVPSVIAENMTECLDISNYQHTSMGKVLESSEFNLLLII